MDCGETPQFSRLSCSCTLIRFAIDSIDSMDAIDSMDWIELDWIDKLLLYACYPEGFRDCVIDDGLIDVDVGSWMD